MCPAGSTMSFSAHFDYYTLVANMNDHTRFGVTNSLEHVSYHGLECFVTTVYRVQRNDAQVNSVKVLLVDEIAVQRNKDIESRND